MLKLIRRVCYFRNFGTTVPVSQVGITDFEYNYNQENKNFITCKNNKLDLRQYQIQNKNKNEINKFGKIPLASNGWKHRKSKGDFFIIHSSNPTHDILNNNLHALNSNINEIFISNLRSGMEVNKLTDIQMKSIRKIIDFNHVLLAAETGSGKTLAYLLPIVQQILENKTKIYERDLNTPLGLIITPGRELATQIGQIIEKLVKNTDLKVETVLGGSTKQKMMNPVFKDIDILVGTMGALSKLVTTGVYRINYVRHVVLDEADTLLDDSFSDKLCHFLKKFPFYQNHLNDSNLNMHGTQLILASATMPVNIKELLHNFIDTETIDEVISPNLHRLLPNIEQKFLRMNKSDRPAKLLTIVKTELKKKRPIIVFGNKSSTSDFISIFLNDAGVNCINLNGDMLMKVRQGRFEQFQNGHVDVLSTTDIGSRGLDTTRVQHVINFDFPLHMADYIHRCGRIGRLGANHNCIITNFVSSQREILGVQKIEHAARTGNILPNVNANITNIIQKRITDQIKGEVNNIF